MRGHTPLTDREIAELRAICAESLTVRRIEGLERLPEYVSRLVLDLLAVRVELRREQRRARTELERARDLLERAQLHLRRPVAAPELDALLDEIDDALVRRRW